MVTSRSFNTAHSPPSPFTPLTFQSEGHFGEDGITHQTLQTLGLDFLLPCCCWRMWYKKWMEMKGKPLLCPFNIQNVYISYMKYMYIYISVNLHAVYFVYYVVYTFDWIVLLKNSLISASLSARNHLVCKTFAVSMLVDCMSQQKEPAKLIQWKRGIRYHMVNLTETNKKCLRCLASLNKNPSKKGIAVIHGFKTPRFRKKQHILDLCWPSKI